MTQKAEKKKILQRKKFSRSETLKCLFWLFVLIFFSFSFSLLKRFCKRTFRSRRVSKCKCHITGNGMEIEKMEVRKTALSLILPSHQWLKDSFFYYMAKRQTSLIHKNIVQFKYGNPPTQCASQSMKLLKKFSFVLHPPYLNWTQRSVDRS